MSLSSFRARACPSSLPGGKVQEVVVLFADIRSFTSLSESLSPVEVLELLSDYHQRMVDALFQQGGTLDKFIGDGIMATFGTPEPMADDARRAVLAGLGMKRALAAMNADRAARGLPQLRQGIGIHCGPAIVGNVGTRERLEYTAIGDTVNTASRIEGACKELGADFLISEVVRDKMGKEIKAEFAGSVTLKGKANGINLYLVVPESRSG